MSSKKKEYKAMKPTAMGYLEMKSINMDTSESDLEKRFEAFFAPK